MDKIDWKIIEAAEKTPLFCDLHLTVRFYCATVGHPFNRKYGWTPVRLEEIKHEVKDDITPEKVLAAYERFANLLKYHVAEYENACDYLRYGYGFKMFAESCKGCLSEEDAKYIWDKAFNRMGNN